MTFEADQKCEGVSVIIPCHNHADFLAKAVDSALVQTYDLLEVIIIDDGSTDESPRVGLSCAKRDPRVRYVRQENAGRSAARNNGIGVARYDFVAFLDADDELDSDFLSISMRMLTTLPESFGMVACRCAYMDFSGRVLPSRSLRSQKALELSCADVIIKSRFPCNVVAKKKVFSQCGVFDTCLHSSEDRDMWIRVASVYRIWLQSESLVRIRRHPKNTINNASAMKATVSRVLAKAYKARAVPRWRWDVWLRACSIYYFQNAWRSSGQGEDTQAVKQLLLSLLLWPWFQKPARMDEPVLFRIRGLRTFLCGCWRSWLGKS